MVEKASSSLLLAATAATPHAPHDAPKHTVMTFGYAKLEIETMCVFGGYARGRRGQSSGAHDAQSSNGGLEKFLVHFFLLSIRMATASMATEVFRANWIRICGVARVA